MADITPDKELSAEIERACDDLAKAIDAENGASEAKSQEHAEEIRVARKNAKSKRNDIIIAAIVVLPTLLFLALLLWMFVFKPQREIKNTITNPESQTSLKPASGQQESFGTGADRISFEIQLRLFSEVKGGGQYADGHFLSQKKHSLLLNFEQKNPDADEKKIVDYIFQNLQSGTWIVDILEPKVTSDGEKVPIGNDSVIIKNGSQYLGYRFKRVHEEAKRVFGEDVILEMIRVGVWIYTNPAKGIQIETVRLYPIYDGDITKEMQTRPTTTPH